MNRGTQRHWLTITRWCVMGFGCAIESEPDLEVVGEAANVAATLEQVSLS